ncbi:glycoside hydrolase family 26 protein [Marinoscillum pacificum]|uniref:glycoside hydrolase family 26 protein n=1 Tax=Marinoscillum pacificum TaxID=392723 RepID=UPI00215827BB|nr:glycoside hydrolase family 26 protein [Marinoscillum pacificum]
MMSSLRIIILAAIFYVPLVSISQEPIDNQATKRTKSLLTNLHLIAERGFMFGHQDDQAYGVGWKEEKGRSDVKESVGTFPAVHGWDVGSRLDKDSNLDQVRFDNMRKWVKKAYKMGSINTFSWHLDNLTTGGNSWDKTPSVHDLLPGGSKHQAFVEQLDLLAEMFDSFNAGFDKIPIIFRPWHEHNGDWFWWGKGNVSEEEYIELFRFTVDYLKNEKELHHLLYAFSPDRSRLRLDTIPEQNYLWGYPGDDYVDIIGIDNYGDVGRLGGLESAERQAHNFVESLKLITKIARDKGKVAALTETGLEGVTQSDWFTNIILNPVKQHRSEIAIAWVLVWRNANNTHHYAPYADHPSVPDFQLFEADSLTYFERDLKNPYKSGKALK